MSNEPHPLGFAVSTQDREMTLVRTLEHGSNVWCSSFADDGSVLVTCSADDSLSVWNLKSGAELKTSIPMIRGCHVCPDSSLIAVCFRQRNFLVYRISDLTVIFGIQLTIRCIIMAPIIRLFSIPIKACPRLVYVKTPPTCFLDLPRENDIFFLSSGNRGLGMRLASSLIPRGCICTSNLVSFPDLGSP